MQRYYYNSLFCLYTYYTASVADNRVYLHFILSLIWSCFWTLINISPFTIWKVGKSLSVLTYNTEFFKVTKTVSEWKQLFVHVHTTTHLKADTTPVSVLWYDLWKLQNYNTSHYHGHWYVRICFVALYSSTQWAVNDWAVFVSIHYFYSVNTDIWLWICDISTYHGMWISLKMFTQISLAKSYPRGLYFETKKLK